MTPRSRVLFALVLAALTVLVVLGWDAAQMATAWGLPDRTGQPMLVVAHRGNMEAWPEDTAEAIWDAARLGADGIEFDVHQSADGTWWVIHDATLDRTTDGTGFVHETSDLMMESLRIDAGPGFEDDRHSGIGPSRLDTILDGLAGYRGRLYVDLQHALSVDVESLVRELGGWSVTIMCRSPEDVAMIEALDSSIATLLRVNRMMEGTGADAVLLEAVGEATVGSVREQPLPVVTYRDGRYAYMPDAWVLRRAWTAGVHAYLTQQLAAALVTRAELEEAAETPP